MHRSHSHSPTHTHTTKHRHLHRDTPCFACSLLGCTSFYLCAPCPSPRTLDMATNAPKKQAPPPLRDYRDYGTNNNNSNTNLPTTSSSNTDHAGSSSRPYSSSYSSPPRGSRTSSAASSAVSVLAPHVMTVAPHSPLHSSYALVLRHRESSNGSSSSPMQGHKNHHQSRSSEHYESDFILGTFFTLIKICMGTGALALPYAFMSGGLAWSALGIVLMAWANYYSIRRLLSCKELLDSVAAGADDVDANDAYAFIASKALGKPGKVVVHFCMGVTFVGCGVSYLIAASDLLEATPLSLLFAGQPLLTRFLNTLLCLFIVLPLSCAKSLAFLSYSSVVGLVALLVSFAVILGLGFTHAAAANVDDAAADASSSSTSAWTRAFSTSPEGLSAFFGICAFSFGIPPLVFPIQGSMARPECFRSAVRLALVTVAFLYILLAETIVHLYGDDAKDIPPNILAVLPESHLATVVRLLVAVVCLMTYPLAIVPLCESVETFLAGPIPQRMYRWESLTSQSDMYEERERPTMLPHSGSAGAMAVTEEKARDGDNDEERQRGQEGEGEQLGAAAIAGSPRYQQRQSDAWSWRRFFLRSGIVFFTAVCSTVVPCFGVVVSFMGAFSVSILSFVLPPLFHLILFNARLLKSQIFLDFFMLVFGLIACIVATSLTAKSSLGPIIHAHQCPH